MKLKLFILGILLISARVLSAKNETSSYIPWYTGPIIAPSASNLKPGHGNMQPYLYVIDNFSIYTRHGNHHTAPATVSIEPFLLMQFGLNSFLDVTFGTGMKYSNKKNINAVNYQNISISFGIQLLREKKDSFIPNIRLSLKERFPSGRYKQLNPKKESLDSGGNGSYETIIGLNLSKIVNWIENHPIQFRFANSITIPSLVNVKDFNSFGGGYGAYGKVRPPYIYSSVFAFEFSINQNWVIASDFQYSHASSTKFSGFPGLTESGALSKNTLPSSYVWSMAPAIEYNINDNLGILTGFLYSLSGKTSTDFLNYVFSVTYTY